MRRLVLRLFRGWPAILLALAAIGSTPAAVAAGCGDHVVIRGAGGQSVTHPADDPGGTSPGAPAPCHGPNCSGSPARDPLPPVAPPAAGGGSKEGVTPGGLEPLAEVGHRLPFPPSDRCPDGVAPSVFHPPRVG